MGRKRCGTRIQAQGAQAQEFAPQEDNKAGLDIDGDTDSLEASW